MNDFTVRGTLDLDTGPATKKADKLKDVIDKAVAPRHASQSAAVKASGGTGTSGQGETKTARSVGAGGGTGSASSDFAAQAQGLGGLVHVYATFAANIFAVSAAFNALSKAADVTNMVKGLDQLGASSGRALGSLAKSLVVASDGALSLKQAMTSTAMATAGGMTNQAIMRMTEVAKKASQALGRDMTDSMDRLTKGIVKIQPELLDELGIMARVIPAQQVYARELGKSASALTDFEKRQAFANAVLAEGEKKFGEINIDANPYSKISASMSNLMQTGLELVNKVLSPIVSILSNSPAALGAAIAALGTVLLKQALPAIGSFRESMKKAAQEATNLAVVKAKEAEKGYKAAVMQAKQHADELAQTEAETVIASEKKLTDLKLSNSKSTSKLLKSVMNTELSDITQSQIDALNKQADISAKTSKTYGDKGDDKKAASYAKTSLALREYATNLEIYAKAEEEHTKKSEEAARTSLASDKSITTAKQNRIIADRALIASSGKQITAQAAETGSIHGIGTAWRDARTEIAKMREGTAVIEVMNKETGILEKVGVPAIGGFKSGWLSLKAGISAATGALGTFMNFMGPWVAVFSIAIAGLQLFDSWASKAAKQIEDLSAAMDTSKESIKLIGDVQARLFSEGSDKWLTAESMSARANAINAAAASIDGMVKKLKLVEMNSNWYDRLFDGLFGKSRMAKVGDQVVQTVTESLKLASPSEAKKAFQDKLKDIYGVKDLSKESLSAVKTTKEMLDKVVDAVNEFDTAQLKSAANAGAVKTQFEALNKVYQDMTTSMVPTDFLSRIGMEFVKLGNTITDILKDPINSFAELVRVANSPVDAAKFGAVGLELVKQKDVLKAISNEYATNQIALESMASTMDELIKKDKKLKSEKAGPATSSYATRESGVLSQEEIAKRREAKIASAPSALSKEEQQTLATQREQTIKLAARNEILYGQQKEFNTKLVGLQNEAFAKGADLVGNAIANTLAQGALKMSSALGSSMTGIAAIRQGTAISDVETSLKIKANETMINLIIANKDNTLAIEEATLKADRRDAKKITDDKTLDPKSKEVVDAKRLIEKLETSIGNVGAARGFLANSGKNLYGEVTGVLKDKTVGSTPEEKAAILTRRAGAGMVSGEAFAVGAKQAESQVMAMENAAKRQAAKITEMVEKTNQLNIEVNKTVKLYDIEAKTMSDLSSTTNSMYFQELSNKAAINAMDTASIALENERQLIVDKYNSNMKAAVSTTDKQNVALQYEQEYTALNNKLIVEKQSNTEKLTAMKLATISKQLSVDEYTLSVQTAAKNRNSASNQATNDIAKTSLELNKTLGGLTEEQYVKEKGLLDLKTLQLTATQQGIDLDNTKSASLLKINAEYDAAIIKINSSNQSEAQQTASRIEVNNTRVAKEKEINAATLAGKGIIDSKLVSESKSLEINTTLAALLARQNESMLAMQDITTNLATLFGEMGTSVGSVTKAMQDMVHAQEKLSLAKEAADKEQDPEKKIKLLAKYEKDSVKTQISGMGQVAGASKKMFGEKTAAYKIMDGIEKASAAMRLALDLKDIAMDMKKFAISIGLMEAEQVAEVSGDSIRLARLATTEAAANTIKTPGIFASFMTAMGPWGAAAAAAAIAMFMGAAFSGGSGGSVNMTGMTAADRQSQGSGQEYGLNANGDRQLMDIGGGVFGDSSAKSQSINNSLDLIAATNVEGITYSNKTVDLLKDIKKGISGVSTSIYTSIGMVGGKSAFGTQEGSKSSPGFIGIGASTSSKEITDAGLQFKGTLGSLITSVVGSVHQYEDVLSKSSNSGLWGLFSSSSESLSHNLRELGPEVTKQIQAIFTNGGELFNQLGKELGMSTEEISVGLSNVSIDKLASLKGLKGAELDSALSSMFSDMFDKGATSLFSSLTKFQKFGEGMLETVARVIDTSKKIGDAFKQMGRPLAILPEVATKATVQMDKDITLAKLKLDKAQEALAAAPKASDAYSYGDNYTTAVIVDNSALIANITQAELDLKKARETQLAANKGVTTNNFALTESLASAAGGLQGFLDLADEFSASYLTDAERLAPKRTALNEQMKELGLSTSITKDGVKDLVLNYKFEKDASGEVTKASAQHYVDLLKLSKAYTVVSEAEQAAAKKTADLENQLLVAQGEAYAAVKYSRDNEIAAMTASDAAIQRRIWRLQDESAAMDTAYADMQSANSAYQQAVTSAAASSSSASASASNEAATSLRQALVSAGQSIQAFIDSIVIGVQSLGASESAYYQDLAAAKAGDAEASKRLPTSGKNFLDAQVKTAATAADAKRATLKMAAELSALPATKTYQQSLLDAVNGVAAAVSSGSSGTTAAVNDASKLATLKLLLDARSEIVKVISIVSMSDMSPDLVALALSDTTTISKTIAFIQGSILDESQKQLALTTSTSITKTVGFVVDSTAMTDGEKTAAFSAIDSLAKAIYFDVGNFNMTEAERTLALAQIDTVTKTINWLSSTESLEAMGPDLHSMAVGTVTSVSKTIQWLSNPKGIAFDDKYPEIYKLISNNTDTVVKTLQWMSSPAGLDFSKEHAVQYGLIATAADGVSKTLIWLTDSNSLNFKKDHEVQYGLITSGTDGVGKTLTWLTSTEALNFEKDHPVIYNQIINDNATLSKTLSWATSAEGLDFSSKFPEIYNQVIDRNATLIKTLTWKTTADGLDFASQYPEIYGLISKVDGSSMDRKLAWSTSAEGLNFRDKNPTIYDLITDTAPGASMQRTLTWSTSPEGLNFGNSNPEMYSIVTGGSVIPKTVQISAEVTPAGAIALNKLDDPTAASVNYSANTSAVDAIDFSKNSTVSYTASTYQLDNTDFSRNGKIYYTADTSGVATPGTVASAKGNIFSKFADGGIFQKFADGGAFANNIVTAPTAFNLGLMGEAGPEAIMPLGRDGSGRLGIRANLGSGQQDNGALIAEIAALRAELSELRRSSVNNGIQIKKQTDMFSRVTQGGEAMFVESYNVDTTVIGV